MLHRRERRGSSRSGRSCEGFPFVDGVCEYAYQLSIPIVWHTASRSEAVAEQDVMVATDSAAHQPTRADISVDAAPEALAWAVTRGGAERVKPVQCEGSSRAT